MLCSATCSGVGV